MGEKFKSTYDRKKKICKVKFISPQLRDETKTFTLRIFIKIIKSD